MYDHMMHMSDNATTVRVLAYYGTPFDVNGVPTRSSVSVETLADDSSHDMYDDVPSAATLDATIEAFEVERRCKVAYIECDDPLKEFDMFEPSWSTRHEAALHAGDLLRRLTDRVQVKHMSHDGSLE